jgi:RNA polymerase sigma factor (sigma-70 family)
MATTALGTVLHNLRRSLLRQDEADLTDGDLLEIFITRRDEAAFEALMRRHGPMVLGVCRRLLRNEADAEDAFQATFLVLVRKAASIRPRGMVGNWLHGVAHSTALKTRAMSTKRLAKEREAAARPKPEAATETWERLHALLDQELKCLPDKYRAPIVLCDLEGKSIKEAAGHLGCPPGTIGTRLARGRRLLSRRLARQGLTLSGGLIATVIAQSTAAAGVPPLLMSSTVKAATLIAAGQAAAICVISAKVATLTEGVLKTMLLTKLKIATAVLLAVAGLLIAGLSALTLPALAQKPAEEKKDKEPEKGPVENQDAVKVVKPGAKSVRSLAYCNDSKTLALVLWNGRDYREGGSVVLWDVQTEKVQHTLEKCGNISARCFSNVTSSKDGTTIAVSSGLFREKWDGAIKVWDAQTGKFVKAFEIDGQARAVALSADGAKVIGGARVYPRANGKMFVWDVKRGEVLQTLEAEGMLYSAAAISDDGKWIAGAGDVGDPTYKGKVVVWEVETGKVKHEWAGLPTLSAVAFSPGGKQVAAAGPVAVVGPGAAAGPDDRVIRVWDMQTGKLKHQLKPEGGQTVTGLVFSPDGETLATADLDGSVSLWDLAKEKTRVTLKGHGGHVFCVAFSPDGRTLASGGEDGTMRFWPVAPVKQPKK